MIPQVSNPTVSHQQERQVVFKNVLWRIGGIGLGRLGRFLVLLAAARFLGPHSFGVYSYIFSVVTLVFLASDWGMSTVVIRELQQTTDRMGVAVNTFAVKFVLSLLCLVAAFVVLFFGELRIYGVLIAAMAVMVFAANLKDWFISVCTALARSDVELLANIWENAVLLVLFFLCKLDFFAWNQD
jgi:O-antigen/teichoic acid export membrane protein